MTIRAKFENMLVVNGLWPKTILDSVIAQPDNNNVSWNDEENGYPPNFHPVSGILKAEALKWIDANKPEAWYRLLFTGGEME